MLDQDEERERPARRQVGTGMQCADSPNKKMEVTEGLCCPTSHPWKPTPHIPAIEKRLSICVRHNKLAEASLRCPRPCGEAGRGEAVVPYTFLNSKDPGKPFRNPYGRR